MSESQNWRGALATGGLAAILASTCCLGPLVLVDLGFSSAWIGNFTALEPYRPIFISAALVALLFAWRRIPGRQPPASRARCVRSRRFASPTSWFSGAWLRSF